MNLSRAQAIWLTAAVALVAALVSFGGIWVMAPAGRVGVVLSVFWCVPVQLFAAGGCYAIAKKAALRFWIVYPCVAAFSVGSSAAAAAAFIR